MTLGSLFSGIGGLELGLEWAGIGPVRWQVEIDPWCRQVLAKHWPEAERHEDVRAVGASVLAPVDVICGGFPCQDISQANVDGRGLDGPKSGLWSEYLRIVGELRPRGVVLENVARLERRGLDRVAGGLRDLGYRVEATILDAAAVGAPFRGARLFLVAATDGHREPALPVDAEVARLREPPSDRGHWRTPAPQPVRLADGVSAGLGRATAAFGNAVVPHCAAIAGARLRELLEAA